LDEQGDYAGAIRNYRKSSEIYEQLEQNSGLTIALINLGTSTMSQGDSARSEGNESIAIEKFKKALDYKFRSLELINQLDYKWAKVYCLHDLGMIYHRMALSDTAISYLSQNIELCKELDEYRLLSSSYSELAKIYNDEKEYRKALTYGQMSLKIAREKGIVEETRDAAEVLFLSHEAIGDDELALDAYKLYIRMRDSLINLENQRSLIQQEYRYEYEKKAIADSISFASEKEIQEVKLEKSRNQRQTLVFVLLVVIGFSVLLINRVRIIRNQKGTIESQNQELNDLNQNLEQKVEERTDELRESEERYKLALDASKDGIFDLDVENDVIKYSPAIYSMLGYGPFEFPETRQEIYNRIYSEDRTGEYQKKHEAFLKNTQEDEFIDEYRMSKKNGDVIWVMVKAKVVERTTNGYPMRVVGTHTDITQEKRKTQILLETVLKTENLERSRISKDIHDGLQQTLTIASLNFQSVKKTLSDLSQTAQDKFNTGWKYLQNSIAESRSVAHSLMPKAIIDFGVVSAFESLISEMDQSTEGTHFQFHYNLQEVRLKNQQVEVTLYRILQESLNNIIKYAKATEVNVHLSENTDMYTLIIEDNGVGFNKEILNNESAGMGFKSMKNRLDAINGILDISSFPGKGTTVLVEINKEF
jgi:PAS domain S-box-containing protein